MQIGVTLKKIIGYFTSESEPSGSRLYLDEVVKFTNFAEVQGDFAIDITGVRLRADPRPYLNMLDDFAAFYSDFIDKENYCLHSMFPSIRTIYPGIIYRSCFLQACTTANPLEELAKYKLISYIPEPLVETL